MAQQPFTKKIELLLTEAQLKKINSAAKKAKINRSEWIRQTLKAALKH